MYPTGRASRPARPANPAHALSLTASNSNSAAQTRRKTFGGANFETLNGLGVMSNSKKIVWQFDNRAKRFLLTGYRGRTKRTSHKAKADRPSTNLDICITLRSYRAARCMMDKIARYMIRGTAYILSPKTPSRSTPGPCRSANHLNAVK